MPKRIRVLLLFTALSACGGVADLEPAPGKSLPVKPLLARAAPDAEQLLSPPPYARPDRVDELVKKSEPRKPDPFDLPPPIGGAAPVPPADNDPVRDDDDLGPVDPDGSR